MKTVPLLLLLLLIFTIRFLPSCTLFNVRTMYLKSALIWTDDINIFLEANTLRIHIHTN